MILPIVGVLIALFPGGLDAQDSGAVQGQIVPEAQAAASGEERNDKPTASGSEIYRELAEQTGGLAHDGGFDDLGEFLDIMWDADGARIAWIRDVVTADEPRFIDVPVDISVSRIDFILHHSKRSVLQMAVLRPDGQLVAEADPDVKVTSTPGGLRRVRVTQPLTGKWQMRIEGQGAYQAIAVAKTKIRFLGVDFVRLLPFGGPCGPAGEDVGPNLLLNEEVYFGASLYGDARRVEFDLISADGRPLERLQVDPQSLDGMAGAFTPRSLYQGFLVRAAGLDAAGNPFQRVTDRPSSVVTFVVREDAQFRHDQWEDTSAPYRFEIRNEGKRERFLVRAETDSKLPLKLSLESVEVEAGSKAVVDVEVLKDRRDFPAKESLMVTITAASNPKALDVARIMVGQDD